jgi:hypothetical protein
MMRGIEMAKAFKATRLLGLLALALGLMAFSATAARAEPGSFWKVNGSSISSTLLPEIQASLENNDGTLLTVVGTNKIEILCESLKYVGAHLEAGGKASGKIHFAGCVTKKEGVIQTACKPHSPGAAEGLIETNALKGLIVLHEEAGGKKIPLLELTPAAGEIFVVLKMGKETRSECAIGAEFNITGKEFLKDCQGEGEVEKVTHLAEEGPLSKLLFGVNPATLDGSANNFLVGAAHEGLKFSGIPG